MTTCILSVLHDTTHFDITNLKHRIYCPSNVVLHEAGKAVVAIIT